MKTLIIAALAIAAHADYYEQLVSNCIANGVKYLAIADTSTTLRKGCEVQARGQIDDMRPFNLQANKTACEAKIRFAETNHEANIRRLKSIGVWNYRWEEQSQRKYYYIKELEKAYNSPVCIEYKKLLSQEAKTPTKPKQSPTENQDTRHGDVP
jgi:hypothetical protein